MELPTDAGTLEFSQYSYIILPLNNQHSHVDCLLTADVKFKALQI